MKSYALLLLAAVFLLAASYITAKGTQWTTDFNYMNQTDMKDNGWTLTGPDGITLNHPGVTLSAGSAVGVYSVPEGLFDWKVDVGGYWLGGAGHSWIGVQVNTERHTYKWVADGSRSKYVFYRDGVDTLHFDGYQESVNTVIGMTLHKIGNTIALYSNSKLITNYVEVDTQLSRVAGVSINAPPSGAVKYVYAGGYVPTPSADTGNTDAAPTDEKPSEGIVLPSWSSPPLGVNEQNAYETWKTGILNYYVTNRLSLTDEQHKTILKLVTSANDQRYLVDHPNSSFGPLESRPQLYVDPKEAYWYGFVSSILKGKVDITQTSYPVDDFVKNPFLNNFPGEMVGGVSR